MQCMAWDSKLAYTFSLKCTGDRLTISYAEHGMGQLSGLYFLSGVPRRHIDYTTCAEHGMGQ